MPLSSLWIWLNLHRFWRRPVRVWGNRLTPVSLDRLVYLKLHRWGIMGREERTFLERTVRSGMHVLDIGANLGLYTSLLSRLVGEPGSVTALEPDPTLFEALAQNCRDNSLTNVRLYNLAAGSKTGRMSLFRSLANAGDNRLTSGRGSALTQAVEVGVETIDAVVAGRPVDFIKIDVQGWETEVLNGMTHVLSGNPDVQICFECWPYGLGRAGSDPFELLGLLDRLGFGIYPVPPNSHLRITDLAGWHAPAGKGFTNLYAVRGDFRSR